MADLSLLSCLFPARRERKKRQLERKSDGRQAEGQEKGAHSLLLFSVNPFPSLLVLPLHLPFCQLLGVSYHPSPSPASRRQQLRENITASWNRREFTACRKDPRVPCMEAFCSFVLQMSSLCSRLPLRFALTAGFVCSAAATNF